MADYREECLGFECQGERIIGLAALPSEPRAVGVLLIVGGPQYRVGSHRQFVLLARHLAAAGFPALRFDVRGMGDSEGAPRDFRDLDQDISAALDAFSRLCPGTSFVLWGLCDAASAALMYWERSRDPRVIAMSILNPWVRSEVTQAQTQIRHYYVRRLLDRAFWMKLLGGKVNLIRSTGEFARKLLVARRKAPASDTRDLDYQDRMALAWRHFGWPLLLILSGQDDTAKEFELAAASQKNWAGLIDAENVTRRDYPEANHTFSTRRDRDAVAEATIDWLREVVIASAKGAARPPPVTVK